jgi:hypothetical protein
MEVSTKIIAIHQPNFFPWLGYFNKIAKADVFIFLDHVQFSKTAGTWSNRVKFLLNKNPSWVTAPIERNYSGLKNINEMYFQKNNPWRTKLLKTLELNYKKAPYFEEIITPLQSLILNDEERISDYNITAVKLIADKLGIASDKFLLSSKLSCEGHSNELLVSLTKAVNGSIYMCGGGAESYQNENIFIDNNILLKRQDFRHPQYEQFNSDCFQPGLSILDTLFNTGWNQTRQLIQNFD